MDDKRISILGMARSGVAAALSALDKGNDVLISECRQETEVKAGFIKQYGEAVWERLLPYSEFGGHSDRVLHSDYIIVSPGIPLDIPILTGAAKKNIKIISEIEYGYMNKARESKIIAVTGSNGKSTTVSLIHHILYSVGYNAVLAGNIGTPLTSIPLQDAEIDYIVLELSSFQLELVESFTADIAVILNITPDHLDRYDSLQDYAEAKMNIFNNQTSDNIAIFNSDDEVLKSITAGVKAKKLTFGLINHDNRSNKGRDAFVTLVKIRDELDTLTDKTADSERPDIYYDGKNIVGTRYFKSQDLKIGKAVIPLPGLHNIYNIMAAILAVKGIINDENSLLKAIQTFKPLAHRLEKISVINGITFINDSKATNTDSVKYALTAFNCPIHIIMGGYDKGEDYSVLNRYLTDKVKAIYFIGESSQAMLKAYRPLLTGNNRIPYCLCSSLGEAVTQSFKNAVKGEVVLLSPACASYDMFDSFEHRGNIFRQEVEKLMKSGKVIRRET